MSADPSFATIPNVGFGVVPATADTSRTAPTNVTTIWTAGTGGGKVEELVLQGIGTTVVGGIGIFVHDGSTYHLWDEILMSAVTPSTTVAPDRKTRRYENLILEAGWTLRVTTQHASNQSLVKATAIGADFG